MDCKESETTCNISDAFGPGIANKCTAQWLFKNFCKEEESLDDEESSGLPSEVDNSQLRAIIKADPLPLHEKLPKNTMSTILWSFGIWSKLERWKNLGKWVPLELTRNKKNHYLKVSSSLTVHNNSEPFLDQVVKSDKKWYLYNSHQRPAWWLDREEAPKHFPKPNLHQKKVMVAIWWFAARLIHYSFLNPGETITSEKYALQMDEMHRKQQHLQMALVSRKGLILLHDNAWPHVTWHFKHWMNWAMKFWLICHIHLITSSSILTTFYRENTSTISRRQKILSKSSLSPEAWIFILQE